MHALNQNSLQKYEDLMSEFVICNTAPSILHDAPVPMFHMCLHKTLFTIRKFYFYALFPDKMAVYCAFLNDLRLVHCY